MIPSLKHFHFSEMANSYLKKSFKFLKNILNYQSEKNLAHFHSEIARSWWMYSALYFLKGYSCILLWINHIFFLFWGSQKQNRFSDLLRIAQLSQRQKEDWNQHRILPAGQHCQPQLYNNSPTFLSGFSNISRRSAQ